MEVAHARGVHGFAHGALGPHSGGSRHGAGRARLGYLSWRGNGAGGVGAPGGGHVGPVPAGAALWPSDSRRGHPSRAGAARGVAAAEDALRAAAAPRADAAALSPAAAYSGRLKSGFTARYSSM